MIFEERVWQLVSITHSKKEKGHRKKPSLVKELKASWQLYVLLAPVIAFFIVFHYMPMYGIQIAFRNYRAVFGITGSPWVGLDHFRQFFQAFYFERLITNTLLLNLYGLLWSFPITIFLALMLNRIPLRRYKKFTQTVVYAPHFISSVVIAGMLFIFLSPSTGLVNRAIEALGGSPIFFMIEAGWFRTIFISSAIWQSAGWGTILYLAALTSIDQEMYEASEIDGASILQKIRYIDLPSVLPIAVMVLILSTGSLLSSNTQRALLLQTPGNIPTSDILGLYVFRVGLQGARFSYTAAIGLFTNVVNFVIIFSVNMIAKKTSGIAMF